MEFSGKLFSFRNEAFKIRTAAELQAERIRKEAAELAAKVDSRGDDDAAAVADAAAGDAAAAVIVAATDDDAATL